MKNMRVVRLTLISVVIILTCFVISKLSIKYGIQTDFLSASATFIAAIIALILFNDWRIQYKTELFERLKDRIHNLFISFESQYEVLYDVGVNNEKDNNLISKELFVLIGIVGNLEIELDFYEKIIVKYNLDWPNIKVKPNDLKQKLDEFQNDLTGRNLEGLDDNEKVINHIIEYLKTHKAYNVIQPNKTNINHDLQIIILSLIDEQKGH